MSAGPTAPRAVLNIPSRVRICSTRQASAAVSEQLPTLRAAVRCGALGCLAPCPYTLPTFVAHCCQLAPVPFLCTECVRWRLPSLVVLPRSLQVWSLPTWADRVSLIPPVAERGCVTAWLASWLFLSAWCRLLSYPTMVSPKAAEPSRGDLSLLQGARRNPLIEQIAIRSVTPKK